MVDSALEERVERVVVCIGVPQGICNMELVDGNYVANPAIEVKMRKAKVVDYGLCPQCEKCIDGYANGSK